MAKIIDGFTFFNELDVLEIRLGELYDVVDEFILVEATKTFTGKSKPMWFADNRERFEKFADKITYVAVDDMPEDADSAWVREYFQRDAIGRGLGEGSDDDLIIVSDVDEIPFPEALLEARRDPRSQTAITWFGADIYRYRINYLDDQNDLTSCPRMMSRKAFKGAQALRFERALASRSAPSFVEPLLWKLKAGKKHGSGISRIIRPSSSWHFSFLGHDMKAAAEKLSSYSHTEHFTPDHLAKVDDQLNAFETGGVSGLLLERSNPKLPRYFRENFERFSNLYVEPEKAAA